MQPIEDFDLLKQLRSIELDIDPVIINYDHNKHARLDFETITQKIMTLWMDEICAYL